MMQLIFLALFFLNTSLFADNSHQNIILPQESSPSLPVKSIPEECRNGTVEAYIKKWETNKINFNNIQSDDTILLDQRYCKTLNKSFNIVEAKNCELKNAPVGYLWKELSDFPTVIGITNGARSDHEPHFHNEAECYYVVIGETVTLANGSFHQIKKGDYFFIPGNTIHNTPIFSKKGFGVIYWYPGKSHFSRFKYYWRKDVKQIKEAEEIFDRVDAIRKKVLKLSPYNSSVLL